VQRLEALAREAEALAGGAGASERLAAGPEREVARVLEICNACRYCEGFCAVFPAMTRRLAFPPADAHYLANLCHNCGACLHACQYAPPHDFAVNVPRAMARVRARTYADYAWPRPLGRLYERGGLVGALALAFGVALFLVLALVRNGTLWHAPMAGDFYAVFPHNLMVAMFGPVFVFACVALGIGVVRFWRGQSPGEASGEAMLEATANALRLTYLDGGHGEGCNDEDDRFTLRRRRYHHFTFYGFLLCFAATTVATIYHYGFGWQAPYALASLPVVLGTLGGIGLVVGPLGLAWLNLRRHRLHRDPAQAGVDGALIGLLFFTSVTGLALLAWRDTSAMGLLLAVHLGFVMALFLTLPYGKFAHAVYRVAALLKWSIERRQPNRLRLGAE
jgi:citrate/tricarballylate utilization protein